MDENEVSDNKIEIEDPMDILNWCDSILWMDCPYMNPHLHSKIRKAVHNQTMEVLTLVNKDIELLSTVYKDMSLDIFKALIAKQIASKKRE